ncbi:MAG: hypothetical protein RLZZ324_916, partial [Candidatus Parcubacteria bacterium]
MTTYDFIASNKRKTWLLIVLCTGLVMGVAYVADRYYGAGGNILGFAGIYAVLSALGGYYAGDQVALATSG